jgi:hypothetical protein
VVRSSLLFTLALALTACPSDPVAGTTDAAPMTSSSGSADMSTSTDPAPATPTESAPVAAGGPANTNACEPCPPTVTPCDALDLACEPLGIPELACLDLHDLCGKGKEKYGDQVCKFAVAHSTDGDAAAVCACAYTCSF